jgi:transcriptional regulator with XRE-family HTH domain
MELGYGLNEFAELAGMSGSQLTRIETGQGMPDATSLHRLAKRLGRSMEWVLTGEDAAELPLDAFVRRLKELRLDKWIAKLEPAEVPTLDETLRVLAHLQEHPALTTTERSAEPAEGWAAYFEAYRASIANSDPRDRRSRRGAAAGRALEDRQVGGKVETGPIVPDDE